MDNKEHNMDGNTVAQWRTDEEMCEKVGDWWQGDMELHNEATMEQNVETANSWLMEMEKDVRVLRCRDADDGLEWFAYEV
jgi:hypothetical protein